MKILHIITGLHNGGAEGALYRLVSADTINEHVVISLMGTGFYHQRLVALGVPVHMAGIPRGTLTIGGLIALWRLVRQLKPDLVQTWMYHGDLLGGIAARLAGRRTIVWGIRHSSLHPDQTARSTRIIARLCAGLSRLVPSRIISCSVQAARVHTALGYDGRRMVVVPNGYDIGRMAPDPAARRRLRAEWGIADGTALIGLVARWNREKDHPNLFSALALLAAQARPEWRCVLVGADMAEKNAALMAAIDAAGLRGRLILLGERSDVPAVMNAIDLHVLSSSSEAFPNVVAEAMACGTPCVVTDVGDAALIVGETGWVVPPSQPQALAAAIAEALAASLDDGLWAVRRSESRRRIEENFSLEKMVGAYNRIWRSVGRVEFESMPEARRIPE